MKEKAIVLFTSEERAELAGERQELEKRLREVRWEEKARSGLELDKETEKRLTVSLSSFSDVASSKV